MRSEVRGQRSEVGGQRSEVGAGLVPAQFRDWRSDLLESFLRVRGGKNMKKIS